MYFQQIPRPEKGCLSYLVGCLSTQQMIVVDPSGSADDYLAVAKEKGIEIKGILDTHIHADHISIGPQLARDTGAPYLLFHTAETQGSFQPLQDEQVIQWGNGHIRILHTPGHSPESVTLEVTDLARSDQPAFILTGDTLLIGDVGRPDLHVDPAEGARDLFRSLHERLLPMADHIEIFPAHFSGSACGLGLSPRASSTMGYERRVNHILNLPEDEFIKQVTERRIDPPEDFRKIIAANRGLAA